jgi:MFS family permease
VGGKGEEGKRNITYMTLIKNQRVILAWISLTLSCVIMIFYETILANYLLSLGISDHYIGYIFGLLFVMYSICVPIVGKLCEKVTKVYLTQLGFIFAFLALIMMGPSEILSFPQEKVLVICGVGFLGFSISFIFVPLLAEIVEGVKEKEKMIEESETLNDLAAALFNGGYAFGCLIAPVLGGFFNDRFGFRKTCDIFGLASIAYAAVLLVTNTIPQTIRKMRRAAR